MPLFIMRNGGIFGRIWIGGRARRKTPSAAAIVWTLLFYSVHSANRRKPRNDVMEALMNSKIATSIDKLSEEARDESAFTGSSIKEIRSSTMKHSNNEKNHRSFNDIKRHRGKSQASSVTEISSQKPLALSITEISSQKPIKSNPNAPVIMSYSPGRRFGDDDTLHINDERHVVVGEDKMHMVADNAMLHMGSDNLHTQKVYDTAHVKGSFMQSRVAPISADPQTDPTEGGDIKALENLQKREVKQANEKAVDESLDVWNTPKMDQTDEEQRKTLFALKHPYETQDQRDARLVATANALSAELRAADFLIAVVLYFVPAVYLFYLGRRPVHSARFIFAIVGGIFSTSILEFTLLYANKDWFLSANGTTFIVVGLVALISSVNLEIGMFCMGASLGAILTVQALFFVLILDKTMFHRGWHPLSEFAYAVSGIFLVFFVAFMMGISFHFSGIHFILLEDKRIMRKVPKAHLIRWGCTCIAASIMMRGFVRWFTAVFPQGLKGGYFHFPPSDPFELFDVYGIYLWHEMLRSWDNHEQRVHTIATQPSFFSAGSMVTAQFMFFLFFALGVLESYLSYPIWHFFRTEDLFAFRKYLGDHNGRKVYAHNICAEDEYELAEERNLEAALHFLTGKLEISKADEIAKLEFALRNNKDLSKTKMGLIGTGENTRTGRRMMSGGIQPQGYSPRKSSSSGDTTDRRPRTPVADRQATAAATKSDGATSSKNLARPSQVPARPSPQATKSTSSARPSQPAAGPSKPPAKAAASSPRAASAVEKGASSDEAVVANEGDKFQFYIETDSEDDDSPVVRFGARHGY